MENCLSCHFLCKTYPPHPFCVDAEERKGLAKYGRSHIQDDYSLSCYKGVWDEGVSPGIVSFDENFLILWRTGQCFWMKYHPGMQFPAADEMQKRLDSFAQLKRTNLYTQIGLWFAGLGLMLNAPWRIIFEFFK